MLVDDVPCERRGMLGTVELDGSPATCFTGITPGGVRYTLRNCSQTYYTSIRFGATVAERLACLPATKLNQVQSPVGVYPGFLHLGIVPDDVANLWIFSGLCRFPPPFITALHHSQSP
ncbi:hypothetical protein PR048_018345 [Dryococelus australis]|uniref:Uncharacterized protein n=1 Tax=Dryococelus australis TaxID=614101 RepID=A0ABQ9HC81_9NEOP|nr:hypothetical protein PR048_018345 [Dryococelus australis]